MKGLDQEILYRFGNVKKPTDDDDFEDLLLEIGHSLEQLKRDAKLLGMQAPLLFGQKANKERKKERDFGGTSKDSKPNTDRKSYCSGIKDEAKPRKQTSGKNGVLR